MLQEFEKATGIKVNFLRFSSGEALARVIAEKNNPRVDVLFGGPVETFAAGIKESMFEPYKPPSFAALPARFKQRRRPLDRDRRRSAGLHDQRASSSRSNNLKPPASWDDLLNPAYKNMLQMADARTSGTAVTRIFSVLEVNGRDEDKAFAYLKKLRPERAGLHQERRRRHACRSGWARRRGGIFFIVDALETKAKGYDVVISFPEGRHRHRRPRRIALIKGAKNPDAGKKLIDWATSPAMQSLLAKHKINFVPAHPDVKTDAGAGRGAEGRQDLPDRRRLCRRQPQAHRRPLGRRKSCRRSSTVAAADAALVAPGRGDPALLGA